MNVLWPRLLAARDVVRRSLMMLPETPWLIH
jgi:hypothetical protein